MTQNSPPSSWKLNDYGLLAATFVPAAMFTWGIHELAHWGMGIGLGYEMWVTFNQAGPTEGGYDSDAHRMAVSMAGPVITWIQAGAAFWLLRRYLKLWIYPFLFLTFWTRALAMGVSLIANPNDEARVSLLLGLPLWALPLVSVIPLLALTYLGSKTLKVGWKGNLVAYFAASLVTMAIVFSDQILFFG